MIKICKDGVYELYCQNRYYGFVRVENVLGQHRVGNFHISIARFGLNVLNRMKRDEETLMFYIKNTGYNELASCIDVTCVKYGDIKLWTKFVKLFEFDEPKLFTRRTL